MRILSTIITLCFAASIAYAQSFRIDFSFNSAIRNNLTLQGAGFGSLPQADVQFGSIPTDNGFSGATDGLGAIVTAQPGEGVMFFAPTVESSLAALVRISVRASHAESAITLATIDQGPDVFVGTNTPNNASAFINKYRRIAMLYTPASNGFQPVLQIVNNSQSEPLTVYVDNWETFTFKSGEYWSADFLSGIENDPQRISLSAEDVSVIPTPTPFFVITPTPTKIPTEFDPIMLAEGKMLYENPHLGRNGNSFTCAICHDSGIDGEDGIIRPGHTMMNAFTRPSWKNGNVDTLLSAVNTCLKDWMNAEPFAEDDLLWKALETYIQSISPDPNSEPVIIEIVTPPDPPTGGDFARGEQLIQQLACIDCHGADLRGVMDDTGGLLAPFLIERPSIPLDHFYIAAKIRLSGSNQSGSYDGLQFGGNMPFWGADRISDQDVRDIAEYLAVASRFTPVPQDTPTPTNTPTQTPVAPKATPTPQPQTGVQVGWTADFGSRNAHQVAGKVTIIDKQTLRFEGFEYDGDGIEVAMYLIKADGETFSAAEGRAGRTLFRFTLGECYGLDDSCTSGDFTFSSPTITDLTEYTHISVWCIPVGVSFGHGRFTPPDEPTPLPTATPTPAAVGLQPGWTADFGTGNSHRVAGKVTVLDEDTIQLEDFQYDGGGIAVELYLINAAGDNFTSAEGRAGVNIFSFTLGECYGLNDTCTDGNFTIDIPPGINLAEYTHISVWCVPVGVSFGHGRFIPPAEPTPQPTATPTPAVVGLQPGWTADFGTGNSHRVAGKVTVLDNDTLQLENFQYDGGGISVALYLVKASGENFTSAEGRAGVSILDFTLGECYGLNDTCTDGNFTVEIPPTINLADYTHISVWCVPVGVSFGHGRFILPN